MTEPTNIEALKLSSDIVEVIGQYIPLKRSGNNWTGRCPFHGDDNPSLVASRTKQYFKCYACNTSGDVFDFVQKFEHCSFPEAMEILCKRVGVQYVPIDSASVVTLTEKRTLSEVNESVKDLCCLNFTPANITRYKKPREAWDYLKARGVRDELIKKFEIGFSVGPDDTYSYLNLNNMLSSGRTLGLVRNDETDTFADRVVFPIFDGMGRVVGFGGRRIDGIEPKYINSSDSLLFNKSKCLFGYKQSLPQLSKGEIPIVMEGYIDVVMAHGAGIETAVATMGTTLTQHQAELLANNSDRIIFCYDSDDAGIKATKQGAEMWKQVVGITAQVRVCSLPTGIDPDEMINSDKKENFLKQVKSLKENVQMATSYEAFIVDNALRKHDLKHESGRMSALTEVLSIISTFTPNHVRDQALVRIVHLHPLYTYSPTKAVSSMVSDLQNLSNPKRRRNVV